MKGTVFDIQRFCVHDGPGIRTTVFMKGCPLRCRWCHNPEGLHPEPQAQFFEEECIGCMRCCGERTVLNSDRCPAGALKTVGTIYEEEKLLEEVLADRDFYGAYGGVTFSGGECLLQADFVAAMLKRIKDCGITTAVDTCGFVPWKQLEKTLPYCDTYLYDIKCADSELHERFTGQGNALILQNLHKLSQSGATIWIRVPVIPDFNDSTEEMKSIAKTVSAIQGVEKVTLMPYHTLGKSKYKTLGMQPAYDTDKAISRTLLEEYKMIFRSFELNVD